MRVEGLVALYAVIAPDGSPRNLRVIRSLGFGLDEKAIEAARKWRFNPGMKDGTAVSVAATIEVNFRFLKGNRADIWYSGQMVFPSDAGLTPPVLKDGTMPKPGKDISDESVVLEFTVSSNGSVENIRAIHGSDSSSELLTPFLAKWKFEPAIKGNDTVEATARVRFVKGQGDDAAKLPLSPPPAPGIPSDSKSASGKSVPPANAGEARPGGRGDSQPRVLRQVEPEYSDAARTARVNGVVVLQITVDVKGNVLDPKVITSLGLGLDEKAIEAVRQWRFAPGYRDGKPVAMTVTVEVAFRLQ
jgi:TonB family protein